LRIDHEILVLVFILFYHYLQKENKQANTSPFTATSNAAQHTQSIHIHSYSIRNSGTPEIPASKQAKQTRGHSTSCLTIGLGNTLNLILLLNRVRVGGSTSGINNLLSQNLGHGLEVAEASLACTSSNKVQGVVHTAERRHIDGLTTHDSSSTNTGAILPGSRVDDGIDQDLDGVLIGGKVDNLEAVHDNADGHELLSIVAALAHEAADEALHDGARRLAETLLLVSASGVWEENGMGSLAGNVILVPQNKVTLTAICKLVGRNES